MRVPAQIVSLVETIGQLRAELEAERRSHSPGASNPAPVVPAATTDAPMPLLARLRPLAPWVLVLLVIGAVVWLLVGR